MTDSLAALARRAAAMKQARTDAAFAAQRAEDEALAARILASYVPVIEDQLATKLGHHLPLLWRWDRPWRVEGTSIAAATHGPLGIEAPWESWIIKATVSEYDDGTTLVYFALATPDCGTVRGFEDLAGLGEAMAALNPGH